VRHQKDEIIIEEEVLQQIQEEIVEAVSYVPENRSGSPVIHERSRITDQHEQSQQNIEKSAPRSELHSPAPGVGNISQ